MEKRGRKPGDGRGRLGGRAKGTPNKDNPLKGYIASHSYEYFSAVITVDQQLLDRFADLGQVLPYPLGSKISQLDIDLALMDADKRVEAEIKLLNYHIPKMQAATIDMTVDADHQSIDQRLADLCRDPDDPDISPDN